jgi:DNA-binding LytR/AlgR family response regulator
MMRDNNFLTIAICDDDDRDLDATIALVNAYGDRNKGVGISVTAYSDPWRLLQALSGGRTYDLFILDMIFPDTNGIDVGRAIRKQDDKAIIAYTTYSKDYALEAFGIQAMDYLDKPIDERKLSDMLDLVLTLVGPSERRFFRLKIRGGFTNVEMDSILYAENISRCATLVLADGQRLSGVVNRGSFEEAVSGLLEDGNFIQIHKFFIVNMAFIRTMTTEKAILDNGHELPISRRNASAAKRAFLKYTAANYREA